MTEEFSIKNYKINIFLRNIFAENLPAENYKINLFLKYIIIGNALLGNLSSLSLN